VHLENIMFGKEQQKVENNEENNAEYSHFPHHRTAIPLRSIEARKFSDQRSGKRGR
jgi:hypothetical protein